MSGIEKLIKDELQLVADVIGLLVPERAKEIDLKLLIEESEFRMRMKDVIDQVLEEKENQLAQFKANSNNAEAFCHHAW